MATAITIEELLAEHERLGLTGDDKSSFTMSDLRRVLYQGRADKRTTLQTIAARARRQVEAWLMDGVIESAGARVEHNAAGQGVSRPAYRVVPKKSNRKGK